MADGNEDKSAEEIEAEAKATAEATAKTEAEVAAAAKTKADSHTIQVDGKDRVFTLEELKDAASKATGADQKFRDASDLQTKAAKGIRVQTLLDELATTEKPKQEDINELAGLLNFDPAEFSKAIGGKEAAGAGKEKETKPIEMGQLSSQLQETLQSAHSQAVKNVGAEVKQMVQTALDKDEILGKILIATPKEHRDAVKQELFDMAHNEVQRTILATNQFGTTVVSDAIQKIRSTVKKLGIPNKSSEQPAAVLGLGPSGTISAEVQAEEPIKRKGSAETGYEDNAVKRIQQRMLGLIRGDTK